MSHPGLSTEEMVDVATIFQESYKQVMGNFLPNSASATMVKEYVSALVLQQNPWELITQDGLQNLIAKTFMQAPLRDFVFSLSFTFFSRWGYSSENIAGLARQLAAGVAVADNLSANVQEIQRLNAVPKTLSERLCGQASAISLLEANKWLMVILMLQLFVSAGMDQSLKPGQQR
jgi:hypothetical protein